MLPIISMKKIIRTNRAGFTLVEVMMVISILGMLVTVAVPQWMKSRENARRSTCLTNLKKIDEFKEQFAFAHNKRSGDTCSFSDLQAKASESFEPENSESEATAALTNSLRADSISNNQLVSNRVVISQASSIVEKKKSEEKRLPFLVIGCLLLGYFSIYDFRKWVDTKVKVPQRH